MVDINLLPKTYRKSGETSSWTYASVGLGLLTLLLIGIPELVIGGLISGKQHTLDDQNAQIAQLNTTVTPRFSALNSQKQQLSAIDQSMQALSATKTSYWSTDLANFVNNMPQQADLNLLTLNMAEPALAASNQQPPLAGAQPVVRDFTLTGTASGSGTVARFLNAYEQNNYTVDLQSTQRSQQGNSEQSSAPYNFSATVHRLGDAPGTPAAGTPAPGGTPAAPGATPTAPGATPAAAAPSAPAAPAAPAASGGTK